MGAPSPCKCAHAPGACRQGLAPVSAKTGPTWPPTVMQHATVSVQTTSGERAIRARRSTKLVLAPRSPSGARLPKHTGKPGAVLKHTDAHGTSSTTTHRRIHCHSHQQRSVCAGPPASAALLCVCFTRCAPPGPPRQFCAASQITRTGPLQANKQSARDGTRPLHAGTALSAAAHARARHSPALDQAVCTYSSVSRILACMTGQAPASVNWHLRAHRGASSSSSISACWRAPPAPACCCHQQLLSRAGAAPAAERHVLS